MNLNAILEPYVEKRVKLGRYKQLEAEHMQTLDSLDGILTESSRREYIE